MTEPRVRWGVISSANIGKKALIPAIQHSSNGEVLAVASRDATQAREFATALNIARAYGSYEALLADPEIEAVYIPLPNSMHREWTIRAAEAGKHILCEKPLALDAAECADMAEAARQNGVLLMEAFMYRFHPQTARVLELLHEGTIGQPRLFKASFSFRLTNPANIRLQHELGGGALMDVGCYCVNASRTMFGSEPIEAQAFATWSASGVDEMLAGSLHFANGQIAQFDCALSLERRETYQIVGSDGMIEAPAAFLPGVDDSTLLVRRGGETTTETIPGVDEYQLMVEHFAACVRGHAELRYPSEEAAANMHAIAALYRSARNGGRPEAVV